MNKAVKGLNPDLHDMVSVTFSLSAIPRINVTDEYNVISFNFKWSSDPAKQKTLIDEPGRVKPGVIAGVGGGVLVAGGIAAWFILKSIPPHQQNGGPLDTANLPSHSQ